MTARELASDRVTVKLMSTVVSASSPSFTAVAFATETVGVSSSSVIVPVPSRVVAPPASLALLAEDRRRMTVSSSSSAVSPLTVTSTVFSVWPAAKVRVPEAIAA